MGFNAPLFISLTLVQFVIVYFFYRREVQQSGQEKGSRSSASAMHSLIFGLFTTIVCPPILLSQYTLLGGNTFETDLIAHIAISYFLSHIVFVLIQRKINSELIHHFICLMMLFYSIVAGEYGQDLTLTIFLGEMTFFYHLHLIAKNRGDKRKEILYNTLFVWTFAPLRILILPIYLYFFLGHEDTSLLVGTLAVFFILSGFYFSFKLLRNWYKRRELDRMKVAVGK